MAALDVEMHFGQRLQQSLVKFEDLVASGVVQIPWFIVVTGCHAESPHDAFKVMLVLKSDVLLDQPKASSYPVINIHSGHASP
jgi:hypothetical protein